MAKGFATAARCEGRCSKSKNCAMCSTWAVSAGLSVMPPNVSALPLDELALRRARIRRARSLPVPLVAGEVGKLRLRELFGRSRPRDLLRGDLRVHIRDGGHRVRSRADDLRMQRALRVHAHDGAVLYGLHARLTRRRARGALLLGGVGVPELDLFLGHGVRVLELRVRDGRGRAVGDDLHERERLVDLARETAALRVFELVLEVKA